MKKASLFTQDADHHVTIWHLNACICSLLFCKGQQIKIPPADIQSRSVGGKGPHSWAPVGAIHWANEWWITNRTNAHISATEVAHTQRKTQRVCLEMHSETGPDQRRGSSTPGLREAWWQHGLRNRPRPGLGMWPVGTSAGGLPPNLRFLYPWWWLGFVSLGLPQTGRHFD